MSWGAGLFRDGGGPVGEGDSTTAPHDCWDHVVEALVILGRVVQLELRAQTEVQLVDGFDPVD